jgi:hypothetical protein
VPEDWRVSVRIFAQHMQINGAVQLAVSAGRIRGQFLHAVVVKRVAVGAPRRRYFDLLARLIVESGHWDKVSPIPLLVQSRDFRAVKLQWEARAAAVRKDPEAAGRAAATLVSLSLAG